MSYIRTSGEKASFNITFYHHHQFSHQALKSSVRETISFNFHIVSEAGKAAKLKITCDAPKVIQIKAGCPMEHVFIVSPVDSFGNICVDQEEKTLENLKITCDTAVIKDDTIEKMVNDEKHGEILIKSLMFDDQAPLGPHLLTFESDDIRGYGPIEIISGDPHYLLWKLYETKKDFDPKTHTISLYKNEPIGIRLQAVDKFGHATHVAGIRITIGIHKSMTWNTERTKYTNDEGIVDYGLVKMSLKDSVQPIIECPIGSCEKMCYGSFVSRAKGTLMHHDDEIELSSAIKKFHILCDSRNPEKFRINCDSIDPETGNINVKIVAGSKIPVMKINLMAEDETICRKIDPHDVLMETQMINRDETRWVIPAPFFDVNSATFTFDIMSPQKSGEYQLKFGFKRLLITDTLYSTPIRFRVIPADPVRFKPISYKPDVWVSNSCERSSRLIQYNLKFILIDPFGNPMVEPNVVSNGAKESDGDDVIPVDGDDDDQQKDTPEDDDVSPEANENKPQPEVLIPEDKFDGVLTATIISLKEDPDDETIPKFSSGDSSLTFEIKRGATIIERLELMEDSPGVDGSKYKIIFRSEFKHGWDVKQFEMTFGFLTDDRKQEVVQRISDKMRMNLVKKNELMARRSQMIQMIDSCNMTLGGLHKKFVSKLRQMERDRIVPGLLLNENSSADRVNSVIRTKGVEIQRIKDEILSRKLRNEPEDPELKGKIEKIQSQMDQMLELHGISIERHESYDKWFKMSEGSKADFSRIDFEIKSLDDDLKKCQTDLQRILSSDVYHPDPSDITSIKSSLQDTQDDSIVVKTTVEVVFPDDDEDSIHENNSTVVSDANPFSERRRHHPPASGGPEEISLQSSSSSSSSGVGNYPTRVTDIKSNKSENQRGNLSVSESNQIQQQLHHSTTLPKLATISRLDPRLQSKSKIRTSADDTKDADDDVKSDNGDKSTCVASGESSQELSTPPLDKKDNDDQNEDDDEGDDSSHPLNIFNIDEDLDHRNEPSSPPENPNDDDQQMNSDDDDDDVFVTGYEVFYENDDN